MKQKLELKPCPFCGGEAVIRMVGDHKQYFVCFCSNCGKTPVYFDEVRLTKRGAIKAWNRRCGNETN